MLTYCLKAGIKIYLFRWGDTTGKGIISRVEVYLPEKNEVHIYSPTVDGRLVNLYTDVYYDLRFYGEVAEYRFKVQFIAHDEADGFPISRFLLVNQGEKVLRRSVFRLNLELMVVFSVVHEDGIQSENEEGKVVDLSAGGCKIQANRKLHQGELLHLRIDLDDDFIIAYGDVKHISPTPVPYDRLTKQPTYAYQYGVSFAMLANADQERIIRFLFKKQSQQLKTASRLH